MTERTEEIVLNLLAGMLSPSQNWTEAVGALYAMVMEDWADDIAIRACQHAARNLKWRPAPAELREIAARLVVEELAPLPGPSAVIVEIRRLITYHGRQAGKATHSHPLVGAVVDEMGDWATVGRMATTEVDAAYPAAYERAVRTLYQQVAETQLSLPAPERRCALGACQERVLPAVGVSLDAMPLHPSVAGFIEQQRQGRRATWEAED